MTAMLPGEWITGTSEVLGTGGGFSAKGGDAAPSGVTASQSVSFNNPFSFASGGSKASATADQSQPGMNGLSIETLGFMGLLALLATIIVRKKT